MEISLRSDPDSIFLSGNFCSFLCFGFYPSELLADQIYCTRANRAALKEKGIRLIAKPLGRPSAVQIHVKPGERNPIEGKFGQAKTAYGLNRKADGYQ